MEFDVLYGFKVSRKLNDFFTALKEPFACNGFLCYMQSFWVLLVLWNHTYCIEDRDQSLKQIKGSILPSKNAKTARSNKKVVNEMLRRQTKITNLRQTSTKTAYTSAFIIRISRNSFESFYRETLGKNTNKFYSANSFTCHRIKRGGKD